MENQHREIKGYRELNEQEIAMMNEVKLKGAELGNLVEKLRADKGLDQRWISIGATDLQTGLMALTRAIAKPTFFALALMLLVGCSGGKKYQSWPMESEINGTVYHYHNAVQLDLPIDTFHGVNSWSHTEVCKTRLEHPISQDEHLYPFQDCKMTSTPVMVPLASVAQQMVTPVAVSAVQAGGFVGMGYFIGDGLSKSGTQVQQNSNADAMNNSGNRTTNVKPSTNINSNNVIKTK